MSELPTIAVRLDWLPVEALAQPQGVLRTRVGAPPNTPVLITVVGSTTAFPARPWAPLGVDPRGA